MKGLILALVWLLLFCAVTMCALRTRRWEKPFKVFLVIFGATLPLYWLSYRLTPPDLWLLPPGAAESCGWVDFWYGLLVYALLFHNFWDFVYAGPMGFSAGLMVELERAGEEGLSREELIDYFRGESGMDRIFGRRLPNLVEGRYIVVRDGKMVLTGKGRAVAALTAFLKNLLSAGEGG